MRIFLIFLLFLFLSALLIVSNENTHLKNKVEANKFANLYYSWLINLAGNGVKATGYVISFDWLPNKDNTNPKIDKISNITNNSSK